MTSSGLPVVTSALSSLEDLPIDTLIAPGGCWGEEYEVEPGLRDFIVARAGSVRRLCSVCTTFASPDQLSTAFEVSSVPLPVQLA